MYCTVACTSAGVVVCASAGSMYTVRADAETAASTETTARIPNAPRHGSYWPGFAGVSSVLPCGNRNSSVPCTVSARQVMCSPVDRRVHVTASDTRPMKYGRTGMDVRIALVLKLCCNRHSIISPLYRYSALGLRCSSWMQSPRRITGGESSVFHIVIPETTCGAIEGLLIIPVNDAGLGVAFMFEISVAPLNMLNMAVGAVKITRAYICGSGRRMIGSHWLCYYRPCLRCYRRKHTSHFLTSM